MADMDEMEQRYPGITDLRVAARIEARERVNVITESDPREVTAALGAHDKRRQAMRLKRSRARFARPADLIVPRWAAVVVFIVLLASLLYAAVQS